ncbi:Iron permease FTR1 [Candidatus Sulfotelmatobacter sp. SbA7]|nr:Iron permease FTR1 [Candidatus Sulfotelmatobacter sp. SbA7]
MLQAFIITLREGVEAALIVGITLAYLAKIGRPELKKPVYAALVSAFLGSIGMAVLLSRMQWNQDVFEGWIMLAAAFFVVTMIVFMMKTGRKLKGQIEGKVGLLAGKNAWFGLFVFVFLMVLREGVETVLILSAVSLNSTELMSFLGTLLGVIAAVLFGVMFVKGSVRINLQKFFKITTVILFFVAAQLTIAGLHELSENGVLPSSRQEMAIIGPIVRNDFFFFVTIFALAALMVLFEVKRREPAPVVDSAAARRKAAWSARRERLWMVSVYASSFVFIVLVTAEFIYAKSVSALSPSTEVTFMNGEVAIPLQQLYDGDLHRYQAKENGVEVRFWLYQKPDGKIATVLDACEICGALGFYKRQNSVICKNCAGPILPQSVGTPGGCNPIPLQAQVTADSVIVREADIAARSRMFQ